METYSFPVSAKSMSLYVTITRLIAELSIKHLQIKPVLGLFECALFLFINNLLAGIMSGFESPTVDLVTKTCLKRNGDERERKCRKCCLYKPHFCVKEITNAMKIVRQLNGPGVFKGQICFQRLCGSSEFKVIKGFTSILGGVVGE